ncbi:MAG: hypothetical protein DRQ62_16445 [Gammaproteobacteria bacterium]|nr:MAG: hypothetical protein DRQ62_16445 [Gammaproteobacteria bacterium]
MKKAIALGLMMVFASLAISADLPKDVDTVDYSLDAPSRLAIDGELTEASPTWHRWRPASYEELGLNCDLVMSSDYTTEPYFDMYCFNVTDSEPVEFVVDSADFDTVIYLYCDPFDPMAPTENAIYMDDDDGVGLLSAIFADNGVTLTPGNDYWFVICSYSSTSGAFSVTTSENVSLCGTVGSESIDMGTLKSYFR